MKRHSLRKLLCLTLAGWLAAGNAVMASGPVEVRSSDISLTDSIMTGAVVNTSAQPVAGLHIHLLQGDSVVATVVSDEQGQFAIRGLRNGQHLLQVGSTRHTVRLWDSQTAPPAANSRMTIVVDETTVRGQSSGQSPLQVAGILGVFGAVVAVTLATTLDDDNTQTVASP